MVHTGKIGVSMIGDLEQGEPEQRAGEQVEGFRGFRAHPRECRGVAVRGRTEIQAGDVGAPAVHARMRAGGCIHEYEVERVRLVDHLADGALQRGPIDRPVDGEIAADVISRAAGFEQLRMPYIPLRRR